MLKNKISLLRLLFIAAAKARLCQRRQSPFQIAKRVLKSSCHAKTGQRTRFSSRYRSEQILFFSNQLFELRTLMIVPRCGILFLSVRLQRAWCISDASMSFFESVKISSNFFLPTLQSFIVPIYDHNHVFRRGHNIPT